MNEQIQIETESAEVVGEPRGNLAAAVAAVMSDVRRLEKADNNEFSNYKFTSVDDYKDTLRPLMASRGLECCLSQTGFERFELTKGKLHCEFHFELWLKHESGESGEREGSTVCLPYTGAQTTGQARSYAQKEWLKSKFLASSGDMAEDADSHSFDVQLSKAEARKIHDAFIEELREIGKSGVRDDLPKWTNKNSVMLDAMPQDWTVYLRNEYKQAQLMIDAREKGVNLAKSYKDMALPELMKEIKTVGTLSDLEEIKSSVPVDILTNETFAAAFTAREEVLMERRAAQDGS